jgi:hypothetical protein
VSTIARMSFFWTTVGRSTSTKNSTLNASESKKRRLTALLAISFIDYVFN